MAEKAAVDSVLGPPTSAWAGGARNVEGEGHSSLLGGLAARSRRDLLLPALHAVQSRFGWVPPGALDYICRRLTVPPAEAYGVVSFFHLFSLSPRPLAVAHVCDDIACRIKGAEQLCADLEHALGPESEGLWKRSPCLGRCEQAPVALVLNAGESPNAISLAPATTADIIAARGSDESVIQGQFESLRQSLPQFGQSDASPPREDRPDRSREPGRLSSLGRVRRVGSGDRGQARKASFVTSWPPSSWDAAGRHFRRAASGTPWRRRRRDPHYVVCNADESEPGTFKDRVLMEGDPFAVLEGMTIAGFATGSDRGFLYVRGEYPLATRRMSAAIDAARAAGMLGTNVMNSGFAFDVELRSGAGAYICGEETALFNSIEGKRGEPRSKPPFPVHSGLFGKPTVINNVESLVNVPLILTLGGEAYSAIGTPGSSGPKLFCVSGNVAHPGVFEVDFGKSLGDLIAMAGGVPDGKRIRAVLLGGAAGTFVGPDKLDMPLTFEGTRAAGASLGSGVVLVFDESIDLGDILVRISAFFRDESCGQCIPCRIGTVRQEELVRRLWTDQPIGSRADEMSLLNEIGQVMRDASICGLGQTASNAIESAFATFDPMPERGGSR